MSLLLTDVQKVTLTVAPLDAAGNPGKIDGKPTWTSSDESIATVAASDDGLSAVVTAVGPLGTVQIVAKADADLGEGVKEISGTLDIEVQGSEAVSLGINAGTPEAK